MYFALLLYPPLPGGIRDPEDSNCAFNIGNSRGIFLEAEIDVNAYMM